MRKVVLMLFAVLFFYSCSYEVKVTGNPKKDAKTYLKLYEESGEMYAQEYLEDVMIKYTATGKQNEFDEFQKIVFERLREAMNDYLN